MRNTVTRFSPEKLLQHSKRIADIIQTENEIILSEVNSIVQKSIDDMKILIGMNPGPEMGTDYERMLSAIKLETEQTFIVLMKQNATMQEKVKTGMIQIQEMLVKDMLETNVRKSTLQSYHSLLEAQAVSLQLAEFVSLMAVNQVFSLISGLLSGERKFDKKFTTD